MTEVLETIKAEEDPSDPKNFIFDYLDTLGLSLMGKQELLYRAIGKRFTNPYTLESRDAIIVADYIQKVLSSEIVFEDKYMEKER